MWPWICTALCLFSRVTVPSPVVSACSDALPGDPEPDLANFLWMLSQFSSVQPLSCVRLFVTPWTAARQASLSLTSSRSLGLAMQIQDSSSPAPLEQSGGQRGWILSLLCSPASCPLPGLPGFQLCSNLSFKRITHDLFCSGWSLRYLTVRTLT